ncbi:MAG: 4Fe-4S dicluster domain-containing protein, partial [Verrucomicrobiaceae bacterium]
LTMTHAVKSMLGKSRSAESLASSGVGVTMQFPEDRWDAHMPSYYRGAPALVTDELGHERCVSCQLCEFICPPKAIKIIPSEIPPDDEWAKVEKRPLEFDIDMIRCIYCGMCEEVCPEQAIFLRKDYLITGYTRESMVHDKKRLYEIGGTRIGLVNKWNELK